MNAGRKNIVIRIQQQARQFFSFHHLPAKLICLCLVIGLFACSAHRRAERKTRNIILNSGYEPDTDKMYRAMENELKIYDPRPGEVMADIGFGSGWLIGCILVHYDSLLLYANDTDDHWLASIDTVSKAYRSLRRSPDTNTLIVQRGDTRETLLPGAIFDKVLIRETFHHFEFPDEMLRDVHRILKPAGRLYIYEPDIQESVYSRSCRAMHFSRKDLLVFFQNNGFYVLSEHVLHDSPGYMPTWWAKKGAKYKPARVYVLGKQHPD